MKPTLILLLTVLLAGCDPTPPVYNDPKIPVAEATKNQINVRVIDGCEYLEYQQGQGQSAVYSLTHKGNCRNKAGHQVNQL
jgi:hypothetical protein